MIRSSYKYAFKTAAYQTALVAFLFTVTGFVTHANELDNEQQFSAEQLQIAGALPKTVVIRVKVGTKQAEVLQSNEALGRDETAHKLVSTSSFVKVNGKGTPVNELDRDSSTSSFGFHFGFGGGRGGWGGGLHFRGGFGGWGGRLFGGFNPGYNPGYNYYGYSYPYYPYYSYVNNGYQYAYYGWPYGGYNPYCTGY